MIPHFRNHPGPTFGAEDGASGGPYGRDGSGPMTHPVPTGM